MSRWSTIPAGWCFLAALLAALSGCKGPGVDRTRPERMPTYAELAQQHNQRIAGLTTLNAAGLGVVAEYRQDGRKKSVDANGDLAIVMPDRVMFTVKHLARSGAILWAGSNATHYWLYDNQDTDAPRLYFGRHDGPAAADPASLGLPLHPRQAPTLLGMAPLPEEGEGQVEWSRGRFVVTAPQARFAYWIEPKRGLVERVEIFGRGSSGWVIAELQYTEPPGRVEQQNRPPGAWPFFPSVVRVHQAGEAGELRLRIPQPSDDGVREVFFDLESLQKNVFKVPGENVVDLDGK